MRMCPRGRGVLVARHSGVLLFQCSLKSAAAACLALITSELCPAFQSCSRAQGCFPFLSVPANKPGQATHHLKPGEKSFNSFEQGSELKWLLQLRELTRFDFCLDPCRLGADYQHGEVFQ